MKKRFTSIIFSFIFFTTLSFATHNRAGEITFVQIAPLTFTIQIHTYTKLSSVSADRDSLPISWGDGDTEFVMRSSETVLPNDNKYNVYTVTHTYATQGTYIISVTDPNRNGGILNVNPPSSDQIPFHIQTQLTILNPQFNDPNNSPILLQAPIDQAIAGQLFVHNPNAFDPDGDSLTYELINPLAGPSSSILNYFFPNEISPGPNNMIYINPNTGEFRWESPQMTGEYNIAILIKEYRQGALISSMIRDMQINVVPGFNAPPMMEIDLLPAVIVEGETVVFEVNGEAMGQMVKLSATGGPFEVNSPAVFEGPADFVDSPVKRTFRWATEDIHVRSQPWQLVFKTEMTDGSFNMQTLQFTISNSTGIFTPIKLAEIQVFPNPAIREIQLRWDSHLSSAETLMARLYTHDGRLLLEQSLQNSGQERIELPDVPKGAYAFTLGQSGQLLAKQMILIE